MALYYSNYAYTFNWAYSGDRIEFNSLNMPCIDLHHKRQVSYFSCSNLDQKPGRKPGLAEARCIEIWTFRFLQ